MAKILGLFEISQVLVIHYYGYWVFSTSKIVAPFLQGLDDSEKFPVINIIVSLGGREGGGVISTRMKVPVGILLHEYSSGGSEGRISHDKEWFGCIWHFDYWCG